MEVENEDVKVRYFNRGLVEEEGDYFYMFSGQATLGSKLYVISVCFNQKEDEKWAEDFFESLSGRVDNEIREQKY